jgi:hypothetical protein
MACRIRYYEYQVAVDFLAPSQQIPVATMFLINHRISNLYPKKDRKGFLLGDPFGGI